MPKIMYLRQKFRPSSLATIRQANTIISEYAAQGFSLTLRQLFYQFVSRNWIRNTQKNYKKLGELVSRARLDGQIDWNAIVDHTRFMRALNHFDSPADIVRACGTSFNVDMWKDQKFRPEIWIEKDALVSVFERVANDYDIPLFSCRGYTSQSGMWRAAMRLHSHFVNGQTPIILHFGDHDPSGLDMSRDIGTRLKMFWGNNPLERLALNMDQVEEHEPPPNPAKMSDSRVDWYIQEFDTTDSWELDALNPKILYGVAEERIKSLIDFKKWNRQKAYQERSRLELELLSKHHDKATELVRKLEEKAKKKKGN